MNAVMLSVAMLLPALGAVCLTAALAEEGPGSMSHQSWRLDYAAEKVRAVDATDAAQWTAGPEVQAVVDGVGAEPYPWANALWERDEPVPGKPAVLVFDYSRPVTVHGLVNYCYRPGSRDQRRPDWLAGPAAFAEVLISRSDDGETWEQVVELKGLPADGPQMLLLPGPVKARYLKLEVVSLVAGAGRLRTYEIDTCVSKPPPDAIPDAAPVRRGFPAPNALEAPEARPSGVFRQSAGGERISLSVPASNGRTQVNCSLEVRVNDQTLAWGLEQKDAGLKASASAAGGRLSLEARLVRAGLLLEFGWSGSVPPPFPKLDVIVRPDARPAEWSVPEYFYSNDKAPDNLSVASSIVPTCISIVGDGKQTLALVPDTDQSWVAVQADGAYVTFPVTGAKVQALLLAAEGGWFPVFQAAVVDVFDFDEPRQFAPVTSSVESMCRFLLQPALWSEKYQMLRSFPDTDFFYIFYSLPYAVPALSYWQEMTGDASIRSKVEKILRFTLDRRLREGLMRGALFSEYADRGLLDSKTVPYGYSPFYEWYTQYPDEQLVGMDQGCSRWITAHNMGAVLWSITAAWRSWGTLPDDIRAGAADVADWLVRLMKEDGSWSYAYKEDGSIASPMSDSGTVWNFWGLYRFGKLSGEQKYVRAAEKAAAYFRKTFTLNHTYRGYWEDIYGGGKTELSTAQGYESSIATRAFAEMGDQEAMTISARDSLRFVCTRVLESRDYWTSYGGSSEQQGWAPGTYLNPAFGGAAHVAWRKTGDDIFRRFAHIAKCIGWWVDDTGGAFWLGEAITQQPIEHLRAKGGARQYWALWDSAQKVAFSVPWLVDEVNRRSADTVRISPESLKGADDRNVDVAVRVFDGRVTSVSGQVNWLWLECSGEGASRWEMALMNHAESTVVTVHPQRAMRPVAIRMFDAHGTRVQAKLPSSNGSLTLKIPEQHMAIVEWH